MYENHRYIIFSSSESSSLSFDEVVDTSIETLGRSTDGLLVFVEYTGSMPSSISNLSTKGLPYSHSEFLDVITSSVWLEIDPSQSTYIEL